MAEASEPSPRAAELKDAAEEAQTVPLTRGAETAHSETRALAEQRVMERSGEHGLESSRQEEAGGAAAAAAAAGDGSGGEEEAYLSDEEPEFLDAENPLLARVQAVLTAQLQKAALDAEDRLRERQEALARAKSQRERVGVELYAVQQQLARAQHGLARTHEDLAAIHERRGRAEQDLQTASYLLHERQRSHEQLEVKRAELQKELDKVSVTLRQVEDYNRELQGDILVTRRAAHGTEEAMQRVEKEKKQQDFDIDRLQDRLRQTGEDLHRFEQQVEAQRAATAGAQKLLDEAAREMARIHAEKREYMQKWQAALVAVGKRDAALQSAEAMARQLGEDMVNLRNQIGATAAAVAAEQREAEKTAGTLAKIQGEVRALESQTALIAERRTRLAEQFSSLKDGVEAASKALAKAQQERHLLQVGLEALHRKRERLLQQKRRAEEEAMEVLGRQASVEKGASEVHRDIQALRRQIHETEQAIEDAKNEMARIRVDALNTEAHNRELGATLEEFTRELRDKDKLVEKYEQEIRQRNDAIEKKQIYIVRLNRRYEQLVSSREEDECTGPLEATIAHLQKEIRNKETESGALQKQWIRGQTDLVAQLAQLEQQEVRAEELRAKEKVVAFRNARLESELRRDAEDVKAMQHDIRNMHQSFARVNELIAKNRQLAEELSRNVASEESAFREKLRELEAESTRLGARVAAVKEEKERLLAEVVEIERQILLWDKKIALERETQDALDPEYGQHELKGLRKEVHRMELRLGQLQRQQERLVGEMERAIVKQESIKLSHISSKSREHVTQASLRQDIVHLKLAIKQQAAESKRAASEVARQEEENRTLLAQLEKLRHEGEAMAEAKTRLDALLTEEQLTRQVALESTRLQQRRAQRLAEARDLKVRRSAIGSEQSLRERIATEDATAAKLVDVVAQLESADPRLARVAAQLKAFAAL